MMRLASPSSQNAGPVRNVFCVMLENRSFENIFAGSGIPDIRAATSQNFNVWNGAHYKVSSPASVNMPTDPGYEFLGVVEQLCGEGTVWQKGQTYPVPNNSGFAANYATTTSEAPAPGRDRGWRDHAAP